MNKTKLKDLPVSETLMKSLQRLIMEKIQNLALATRRSQSPVHGLVAEIAVLEARLEALMSILEEKNNVDFSEYNTYLENAADAASVMAVNSRTSILSQ